MSHQWDLMAVLCSNKPGEVINFNADIVVHVSLSVRTWHTNCVLSIVFLCTCTLTTVRSRDFSFTDQETKATHTGLYSPPTHTHIKTAPLEVGTQMNIYTKTHPNFHLLSSSFTYLSIHKHKPQVLIQYWMAWGWYLKILDELHVWKISDDAKRSPIFFIHVANPIFSGFTRKKPSNICIIMSQNLTWINAWKVNTYLPND